MEKAAEVLPKVVEARGASKKTMYIKLWKRLPLRKGLHSPAAIASIKNLEHTFYGQKLLVTFMYVKN